MTNYTSELIKGAGIIFGTTVITSLLGYFIRIVLAKKLSPEEFGLFFAVYNVVLLIGWIKGFGLSSSIGKYIPELSIKGNTKEIRSILAFVTVFTIMSSFFFVLLAYFLPSGFINGYFKSNTGRSLLVLLLVFMFIDGLSQIVAGYFLSVHRYFLYNLRDLVIRASVLGAILLWFDLTVLKVGVIYIGASLLALLFNFFFFSSSFPLFRGGVEFSKDIVKKLFQFSTPLMIRDIFGIIMARVDNLVLLFFRPLVEVAIYNAILPTADLLLLFARPFARIMFPLSSELDSLQQQQKIIFFLKKIHKHLLVLLVPLIVGIFLFSGPLLSFLFGKEYALGYQGLNLLSVGLLFASLNMVSYSVLLGLGKPKEATVVIILSNLLNLALNLVLIPYFGRSNQGYVGAIIATVVSTISLFFLLSYYLAKYISYQLPLKDSFFLLVIGILLWTTGHTIASSGRVWYWNAGVFAVVILLAYPLLLLLFGVTSWGELKSLKTIILQNFRKDQSLPPPSE